MGIMLVITLRWRRLYDIHRMAHLYRHLRGASHRDCDVGDQDAWEGRERGMKQQINQTQYEQLSPAARMAYIAWTMEQGNPAVSYRAIPHLIKFIDDHMREGWWHVERDGDRVGWRVQAKYVAFDENGNAELVDALWEAVKVLLDEEREG